LARVHPVFDPWFVGRLVGRGRLGLGGWVVVEEKLDGWLVVGFDGVLYWGSGRRVGGVWRRRLVEGLGLDLVEASRGGRFVLVEVYGGGVRGEGCWHCGEPLSAAVVGSGRARGFAGGVVEAVWLGRHDGREGRVEVGERVGAGVARGVRVPVAGWGGVGGLFGLVSLFPGREGVVVKLEAGDGHRLPPDGGARLRGLLEVKVKVSWASSAASAAAGGEPGGYRGSP